MKIPKRIWTGLAGFSLLLLVVFSLSGRALASVGQSDLTAADNTYTFLDGANIQADVGGAGTVTFSDTDLIKHLSKDRVFVPPDSAGFCKDISQYSYNPDKISQNIAYGITVKAGAISQTSKNGTAAVQAQLKLGYNQGQNCLGALINITVDSADQTAATVFQWNGNNIVNLNNTTQATFAGINNSEKQGVYINPSSDKCGANAVIKLNSENVGNFYQLSQTNDQDKLSNVNE
jgi:hypothetical protein